MLFHLLKDLNLVEWEGFGFYFLVWSHQITLFLSDENLDVEMVIRFIVSLIMISTFPNSLRLIKIKFVRKQFFPHSLGPFLMHLTGWDGYKNLSLFSCHKNKFVKGFHIMKPIRDDSNAIRGIDERKFWECY